MELIVLSREKAGSTGESAAEILAQFAALSTSNGDPRTSIEHDKVLYGEQASDSMMACATAQVEADAKNACPATMSQKQSGR